MPQPELYFGFKMAKAVAKSCGGQVQSIPHVIQGAAGCQAQLVAKKAILYSGSDTAPVICSRGGAGRRAGVSSTAST